MGVESCSEQVMDIIEAFANKDQNVDKFLEEEDQEEIRSGMSTGRSSSSAKSAPFRVRHSTLF